MAPRLILCVLKMVITSVDVPNEEMTGQVNSTRYHTAGCSKGNSGINQV